MIELKFDESGGSFSQSDRDLIREISDAAEQEIRAHLPKLPSRIELRMQTGNRVIPETGNVGGALAPGCVYFMVDPTHAEGIDGVVRSHLRPTLFHEFHHLVRGWVMTGGTPRTEFIDGVICEGLATAFERDAAGSQPLWGAYPPDVKEWVRELMLLPITANYAEWMFLHPDGRRWVGYRAGTFIADQAIERSGRTAADLVETPYEEVLAMSGFAT